MGQFILPHEDLPHQWALYILFCSIFHHFLEKADHAPLCFEYTYHYIQNFH